MSDNSLPGFVCVGGAKCGTTSLYEYLRRHPEVFLPDQKELHFFSYPELKTRPNGPGMSSVLKGLISSEAQYRSLYREVQAGQIGGDISPSYLNEKNVPQRIVQLLGMVKIIILLRNPVERVFSQYMHLRRAAKEDLTLREAIAAEPQRAVAAWGDMWQYTNSAYASERVQRYIDFFGSHNVLVVLSEELRADPQKQFSFICRHIGISDNIPIDFSREFNKSGIPKYKFIARLIDASPVTNFAKAIIPRRLGSLIKRKIQEINTGNREDFPSDLKRELRELYREEISALERILKRSTGW